MSLTDPTIIDAFMGEGHLVLAISILTIVAAAGYFLFPFLFQRGLDKSMRNGFGEALSEKMELAVTKSNDAQAEKDEAKLTAAVELNDRKLERAFREHEEREDLKLRNVLLEVETRAMERRSEYITRLDDHDRRLSRVESAVGK